MKKIIKNTIVFASVLILSLMTSIIFMGSRVKAADLGDGSFSVKYDDIDEYYGEKAPEYQNGYLFAGWYTDEMCTSSYVRKDGDGVTTFYAKFVPQAVLSVKAQHAVALHNKVLADTDTGSIRFVTATDSNNYNEVGLHVEGTIGSHTLDTDYKVGTIYSYLYVVGDTTNDKSNPVAASAVFGTDAAEYFAPHAFKINFTQFDDDFTITPYWITPDGVRVDGVVRTRNMIENLEEYSYAEVNGRAYYSDSKYSALNEIFATTVATFTGTEAEPTVITLLKEALTVTATVGASSNSTIVDTSVVIQNKKDMNVTISRGNSYKGTMFDYFNDIQLGSLDESDSGTLIVDGYSENAISGRTVNIRGGRKFVLAKNATLQNANCNASGAAIVNRGTCDLYGTIKDNQSSNAGSESGYAAGAILQCRGNNPLTIHSGTYTGNKNTGTYGGGGLIGTQVTNTAEGSAGPITIKGGFFSANSANEGGVLYVYTTQNVSIKGGEFSGNSATTYGGVISTVAATSTDNGANILISGGEFTSTIVDEETAEETTVNAATRGGVVYLNTYGTLTISGGKFTGNQATRGGVVESLSTVTISGGEFTFNEVTNNAGVVYLSDTGTLTISDGTFQDNTAASLGGVIHTASTGTVTIEDGTFRRNSAKSGGVITTSTSSGSITIENGTFEYNSATANGGVVVVNTTSSLFTVNGGTFTANTAVTYGGVIHTAAGTSTDDVITRTNVIINGGTFTSTIVDEETNEETTVNAAQYGGVVYLNNYGTLTINTGRFVGNIAEYGGVISTSESAGVVTINDGMFTENEATEMGGVAYVRTIESLFSIVDGQFTYNRATDGGVIATPNNKVVNIAIKGTFSNNSADRGGVVYLNQMGKLDITGGTFEKNVATGNGAGVVFVASKSSMTVSNATMTGNCTEKSTAFGGGAILLTGASTATVSNSTISGNTHQGALTDETQNTNGCDIAFRGNGSGLTSTLILQDDSFTGIVGHTYTDQISTIQVQFSDKTTVTVEWSTRYTINYNEHTLEKVYAHRVILVSDMHYTTNMTKEEYDAQYSDWTNILAGTTSKVSYAAGPTFGYSQDEKIQAIFSDIDTYIAKEGAIESVMLLGDLSIDNKGYSNLREDYLSLMKTNFLDKLSYPWYAIAGNHDSYTDSEWEGIMGTGRKRQYSVVVGDAVFIMLDTFEATHATSNSGSSYVGVNTEFLATELAKEEYANKKIFLCSHYYRPGEDTEEDTALQKLIANDDRIVCMFRGHSHTNAVYEPAVLDGRPLVDIGGYAYNSTGTSITLEDGTASTTYNVFSEANAWGYQVLEWDDSEVHLYHVKPARKYTDYLGVEHDYAGAIENEVIIKLN